MTHGTSLTRSADFVQLLRDALSQGDVDQDTPMNLLPD